MLLLGLGCCAGRRAHRRQGAGSRPADEAPSTTSVRHYEQFGIHRYGSAGADGALDWLAGRLRAAGLKVEEQPFAMERQYFLDQATLTVDAKTIAVLPQWWIPEDKASFELNAPIARDGDAAGKFVRLHLSYDQGAYLNKSHRDAIAGALARKPAAVLLTIGHPSGEIFTYNVAQSDTPWPVPVILVAPGTNLARSSRTSRLHGDSLGQGPRYEKNVAGRNVIGRLDRGKDRTIVVSTPVTSWFTSTCERSALPSFPRQRKPCRHVTAQRQFRLRRNDGPRDRPRRHGILHPRQGAEAGCEHQLDSLRRIAGLLPPDTRGRPLDHYTRSRRAGPRHRHQRQPAGGGGEAFPRHAATGSAVGKNGDRPRLREIQGAGYPDFVGMFGLHPLFHTPQDSAAMTGPAALEPVMHAFAATLTEISNKPGLKRGSLDLEQFAVIAGFGRNP